MLLSNSEMMIHIDSLSNLLERKDIIGYAAARNTRFLSNASAEYNTRRQELFELYGTDEIDEKGNLTGRKMIPLNSDAFEHFKQDISELDDIEHDVTIMTIPYSKVIGELTGSEILSIDWMLDDSDSPADV